MKSSPDPLDHQDFTLRLYFPHRLGVEAVEGNLTRCQRASKGAQQSATGRSDEVVQRRSVRFLQIGRNPVVLGNLAMDAKHHRFLYGWEMGAPDLAFHRLHPDL